MAEKVPRRVAIVGASARAATQSALRAGLEVVAADLFADEDLRRLVPATKIEHYPRDLLEWLRAQEVDGWFYTGALENCPRLVEQMAQVATLYGNRGRVLRRVRNPIRLARVLKNAGLSYPAVALNPQQVPTDGSWLFKPLRGASGAGISAWHGEVTSRRRNYWQQRVDGTPKAALFVGVEGRGELLGITKQLIGTAWSGAHGFQYSGTIGPWPVSDIQRAEIIRIGEILAREFSLRGLFGVDLMLEGDRVWTIEVNPRYTAAAEVVERVTGKNMVAAHLGIDCAIESANPKVAGKVIMYARQESVVSQWFTEWGLESNSGDVPAIGTVFRPGMPVLSLFAHGETAEAVETNLQQRVVKMEDRLYVHMMRAVIEWIPHEQGGRRRYPSGVGPLRYASVVRFVDEPLRQPQAWTLIVERIESLSELTKWIANVYFFVETAPHEALQDGREFEMYEGAKCVARGKILGKIESQ